ncbi:MAG: hypothetical protein B5766_13125 [Candidatus Lumbricidophila eiseniae]|uniref:Uncharacterized protein n=1 Tax=Candidatus Lumbricidiphila eiseniae TaxID=1969409 RepID=A0A2A6FMQ1_9MICO|nr:MAG: hypothetical protein B5766_13125 [Candidatus Lumbricidophila eiseniae]
MQQLAALPRAPRASESPVTTQWIWQLHFLVRHGRLSLNVALRSNDVLWGFSGINTFEWSVLQEMMAYWVGVEIGPASFFPNH